MGSMVSKARLLGRGRTVIYAVHDARGPTDAEWARYVENARQALAQAGDPERTVALSITDAGAPNASQRRIVLDMVREVTHHRADRVRSSVISDNLLVRGVVAAFAWYVPEIRIFAPSALHAALEHVRLADKHDLRLVREDLEELANAVPAARTVRILLDRPELRLP
jgi:hypothetical protein